MNKKLKLGVVGFGRMGITHCAILNKHPNVTVQGIVDINTTLTTLLSKYSGYNINIYKNHKDLFSNHELDGVIICTPPKYHYAIATDALEFGLNVFIEIPCKIESSKAKILSELYEKKRLVNHVGYVNRHNKIFIKQKEYLKKGAIGKIINFRTEMFSRTITKSEKGVSWRESKDHGGGATIDMAAHAIDLMNYMIGIPKKISGSILKNIFSLNVEDTVNTTFQYEDGISGTLYVNWSDESYRKPVNNIEIFGNEGKISGNQYGLKIYRKSDYPDLSLKRGWNSIYITDVFQPVEFYLRGNEFTSQLDHFINCITDRDLKSICTFEDAANTLKVIEDIFEDFERNKL